MSQIESLKGSKLEQKLSSPPSSKIRSSATSKTFSKNGSKEFMNLLSLSSDIFDAFQEETAEFIKSTEEVCVNDQCFTFKNIPNPGLPQAYYVETAKQDKIELENEIYHRLMKEAKRPPIKRVVDSLNESSLDLQYYGLDSKHIMPITIAMHNNRTIEMLNLSCNVLSLDALYHLGQMLRKNKFLSELNLRHCNIGPDGAEMLGNGLEICEHLVTLDLSHNNIGDDGMENLAIKLGYNISIHNLNLSHNNLTYKSGIFLAETMEENITLQNLNLSWNQICNEQGLKPFLNTAVEENESLQSLDLSWNSLGGDKIANIIKNFIGQHKTIQTLNLSHNKFETSSENIKIAKGISTTESLQLINLSFNGITADTAFALLSNISNRTKLKTLHLDNVWVKPEFEKLRRDLKRQCGLTVFIEGVSGGFDIKGPDMQELLLKRAHFLGHKPKKNKKDFGWFLLRLQKAGTLAPVKKSKFEKIVKEDNIDFDEGMIDEFAKRFRDENKKIDLNLMLEKYMRFYPETALPVPKEKKRKKSTEIEKSKSPTGSKRASKDSKKSIKEPLRTSKEISIPKKESLVTEAQTDPKGEAITEDEILVGQETNEIETSKKDEHLPDNIVNEQGDAIEAVDDNNNTDDREKENKVEIENISNNEENNEPPKAPQDPEVKDKVDE